MLFAICADRGAPGSTTTALALAAARGLPAVAVEADPYGGDLALRVRRDGNPLPTMPTVLSVSAGRSAQEPPSGPRTSMPGPSQRRHRDLWRDGSHQLSDLVRVVPGFMAAEHGTSMAWPVLASALEAQTVPVFADLGRIHTGSPSLAVAAAADALIPVCRSDMASVQHMIDRLELLVPAIADRNGRPPIVLPVVIAPRQHGSTIAGGVAEILGETTVGPTLRGVGWLAWDPAAVAQLESGADPWAKPLYKSPLMKSARKVMWMVGLATGLSHADPTANKSRGKQLGSRRRRREDQPAEDAPQSWASPYVQPDPPEGQESAPGASPESSPLPFPPPAPPSRAAAAPPTWTPRHGATEAPRNGTNADEWAGEAAGETNGQAAGQEAVLGRWGTAARQERH